MKILMSYKHYPMCGGNYFRWAMETLGHEVVTIGYFSGNTVPWEGDPKFPKYVFPPTIALTDDIPFYPYTLFKDILPWKPDLVLQIDAGFYLTNVPTDIPNALFATDPHFLDYKVQHKMVDFFFNPQPAYMEKYPKSLFLPWAYDPNVHKVIPGIDKIYDIVFVGLLYENRAKALQQLAQKHRVFYKKAGIIFEECTQLYNQGRISFNWSSRDDIPMRIFEGMAYGDLVVSNRITGMELLFKEGKHYVAFSTFEELADKIDYYLTHQEELDRISMNGYLEVEEHTYINRCKKILKEVFHK